MTIPFPTRSDTDALHELITQTADTRLELGVRLRVPFGSFATGNGARAFEGNVEHVGGFVPVVAIDAGAKAGGGERKRGFPHQRSAAIGSVGVTPYTVYLRWNKPFSKARGK